MKTNVVHILSFILALALTPVAFAGNSGGGGNSLRSSAGYVKLLLKTLSDRAGGNYEETRLFQQIQTELNQKGDALHITDPELRDVFLKMLGTEAGIDAAIARKDHGMYTNGPTPIRFTFRPVMLNLQDSKIAIKEDGPCIDSDGKPADASVSGYFPKSDICFSVPRLQKYPSRYLGLVIESLLVHELAHQFGYKDERLMKKVQSFVYNHIFSTCKVSVYFPEGSAGKGVWHRINTYPKRDGHIVGIGDTNASVEDEFTHTEQGAFITATTVNTPEEYEYEINKKGKSRLKFSVLNSDLTKSPIEVTWETDFKIQYSVYGALNPWQNSKKGTVRTTGTYNGKPVQFYDVQVDTECFYISQDQ